MRVTVILAALMVAGAPVALSAQGAPDSSWIAMAPDKVFSGSRSQQILAVQVMLDRSRFAPGVIDGYLGENTRRAIRAFQRERGVAATGEVDDALLAKLNGDSGPPILESYTISEDDVAGPFAETPTTMTEMAKLDHLSFETPLELLSEKFHMDADFVRALNPDADFSRAGTKIVVAGIARPTLTGKVDRIEVDRSSESVRAYASDGTLLARYPATIGSGTFPSPSGAMEVTAIAPDAKYYFDPEGRDWGPDERLTIAAGPNNPIGGTWIDLSKEGYGIHGSPDPTMIGKQSSHGCVRLTNWDAQELAAAVSAGTTVEFI